MEVSYRVMMTVHDEDQKPDSRQLNPHYMKRGVRVVCGGMSKEEAEEYANKLQRLVDTGTVPFVFTTYSVEKEYPEPVV